jgi:hypothetical protein
MRAESTKSRKTNEKPSKISDPPKTTDTTSAETAKSRKTNEKSSKILDLPPKTTDTTPSKKPGPSEATPKNDVPRQRQQGEQQTAPHGQAKPTCDSLEQGIRSVKRMVWVVGLG